MFIQNNKQLNNNVGPLLVYSVCILSERRAMMTATTTMIDMLQNFLFSVSISGMPQPQASRELMLPLGCSNIINLQLLAKFLRFLAQVIFFCLDVS